MRSPLLLSRRRKEPLQRKSLRWWRGEGGKKCLPIPPPPPPPPPSASEQAHRRHHMPKWKRDLCLWSGARRGVLTQGGQKLVYTYQNAASPILNTNDGLLVASKHPRPFSLLEQALHSLLGVMQSSPPPPPLLQRAGVSFSATWPLGRPPRLSSFAHSRQSQTFPLTLVVYYSIHESVDLEENRKDGGMKEEGKSGCVRRGLTHLIALSACCCYCLIKFPPLAQR